MLLENLPDDILIIIIKKLDLKSLSNLHSACNRIRNLICTYGIIKTCNVSLNVMAKTETLKSSFFKDISRNLQELNVCGMQDLSKTTMLSIARQLKCLNTLNVMYTNITIPNLIDIYKVCPTVKDISINFTFGELKSKEEALQMLEPCQDIFTNYSNVHFVGGAGVMIQTKLPSAILKKAKLNNLQYSITDSDLQTMRFLRDIEESIVQFDSFTMYFIKNSGIFTFGCFIRRLRINISVNEMPSCMIDSENYEIFIIKIIYNSPSESESVKCYASSLFKNFFIEYSDIPLEWIDFHSDVDFYIEFNANACVMLWNKSSTTFDQKFFKNLWRKVKPFIPCYFQATDTPVPSQYNFYMTSFPQTPLNREQLQNTANDISFKKKRVGAPNTILNYDTAFQEKSEIQLNLAFMDYKTAVTLSPSCEFLNKLTYLCLSGTVVYSQDFFNVLFGCCNKLTTLVIKAPSSKPCYPAIAQYINLSQSLKNILLWDEGINYHKLFSSMSLCKTLENVQIFENAPETTDVSSPITMFEKCENLYCLYIFGNYNDSLNKRNLGKLKEANVKCQTRVALKVLSKDYLPYHPYFEVFKLNFMSPLL